jgi:histidinol-phosphate/aromatic aminotransferase/cobyric acid decarboxylase-like protein
MKLSDELRSVREIFPAIEGLLDAAAQRIEDAHLWRAAWLKAEEEVDQLTKELELLRSQRVNRKEKECED